MVELVDTQDLKSCGHLPVRVQVPLLVPSLFTHGSIYIEIDPIKQ